MDAAGFGARPEDDKTRRGLIATIDGYALIPI
jgi:hypothetical protein